MSDFAQNFIAGVQAGQARAKAQKDYEIASEERDLKKQMLKHQMDRLKIEDQLHARELTLREAQVPQLGVPTDPASTDPVARGEARDVALPAVEGMAPASSIRLRTDQGKQIDLMNAFKQQHEITAQEQTARSQAEMDRQLAVEREKAKLRAPDQPTIASIAIAAAQGNPEAQRAMSMLKPERAPDAHAGDAEDIADAIVAGDAPPSLQGMYRLRGPVQAALSRKKFNLTTANLDWEATKKHLASLNGVAQTRLRQAVDTASDSLDVIDNLSTEWNKLTSPVGGRLPLLNAATLKAAKGGLLGVEASKLATALDGQITDVVSELGQIYMGGNSPTDHALKLAEKNLSASWSADTLKKMTDLARQNLAIRRNSMVHSTPITTGTLAGQPQGFTPPPGAATKRFDPATGTIH